MHSLSFYDKQHLQKVITQQKNVSAIFSRFVSRVSPFMYQWKERKTGSVWVRNGNVENNIDQELTKLQKELLNNISSFQFDAWKRSNLKNEDLIKSFVQDLSVKSIVKEGMFTQNISSFQQFIKRVDQGFSLSENVWGITSQTKKHLEFYLGSGISVGKSADSISRDVRQLLNNPDKRFRRVRNEDKKLVLSQPMKDYHPGAGVYRSPKMNALRLAATETNRSYRKADYERWQEMKFVTRIEIKRSGNNKGPCKICDHQVGEYPKEFEFLGFHPFCICFAVPKVMEPDDFADFLLDHD